MWWLALGLLAAGTLCTGAVAQPDTPAPQWQEVELTFTASREAANPYTELDGWVDFTHEDGSQLRRPMFWDGDRTFRVRFASTRAAGVWRWESAAADQDPGLHGRRGTLTAAPGRASTGATIFERHGFWSIPPGGRNLVHADGTPRLLAADTPWALPWRATVEQAGFYARDRRAKGYNAALLMTVQPDMKATGPRSRTEDLGFDVGFEDLPEGTLRRLNPEYFQYLDRLIAILVEHGIAPVYQPVFHGYGWKGRTVAGNVVSAEDYARYCRYLVARYGARPAIWLVGGDGPGTAPAILEQLDRAGTTIRAWDAHRQPIGIHYSPHALNRTHQEKDWLDFQWCQTGHNGEHVPERVADMWRNLPVKAVANGEPTYENIGRTGRGAGWWQGHEAWLNLTAGGTMGVVYGAASLWQWRLHANEPDHADWCTAPGAGWREALDFEGSVYPGIVARIFDGLPLAGMEPNWIYTYGRRGLAVPGKLFVLYLPEGGNVAILSRDVPRPYRVHDPRTGEVLREGRLPDAASAQAVSGPGDGPRVLVFFDRQAPRDDGMTAQRPGRRTAVSIVGDAFHINGRPTYEGRTWRGHKIEGLLMNSRMVQGIFDDLNPATVSRWAYPDTGTWDADRNTREFIEAMPEWRRHGLLCAVVNLQGGSPEGYSREQPWHNSAIRADGSLRPEYLARLERILERADELGMVIMLGIFYFGQDQRLDDDDAVRRAVLNTVDWLADRSFTNVLLEIANECDNGGYVRDIIKAPRVHELIQLAQERAAQRNHPLPVSVSYNGGSIPRPNVVRTADYLLLHGNGVRDPRRLVEMIRTVRQMPEYRGQPIVNNEDDRPWLDEHQGWGHEGNNLVACVTHYVSWGYFDFRRPGEDFNHGFQSVPVNWRISSDRKRDFFRLVGEITGGWISLFDGRTLSGWTIKSLEADRDRTFWTVEEGAILANSMHSTDHGYVWLLSDREYADFELRLKVRSWADSPGNSGIQVRSRYDDAAGWLDGPQIDIHPPAGWRSGLIYDETRGHQRWIFPSLENWRINPDQGPREWHWIRDGWNDVVIRCQGTRIRTGINGHVIADYDGAGVLDDDHHRKRNVGMNGFLALQLHQHDRLRIAFKDIQIRLLDD